MATRRAVLEKAHQHEFENPPLLTRLQRQTCFQLDEQTKEVLKQLDSPVNQAGFLLQLGYFRATTRFFAPSRFRPKDWAFVTSRLRLTRLQVRFQTYALSTARYHRQLILRLLTAAPFRGSVRERCQQEADQLVAKGLRLPAVFGSLCDFLRSNRQEVPAYSVLAMIIDQAIRRFDAHLQQTLAQYLQPHQQRLLDELLDQLPAREGTTPANSPLLLTQLRDTGEVMSVKAIRQNVAQLRHLKALYQQCRSVLDALSLSDAVIETYALQVMRSRSWQVKQWLARELYRTGDPAALLRAVPVLLPQRRLNQDLDGRRYGTRSPM